MEQTMEHQAEYEKLGFIRVNLNCEDCTRLATKIRELETQLDAARKGLFAWREAVADFVESVDSTKLLKLYEATRSSPDIAYQNKLEEAEQRVCELEAEQNVFLDLAIPLLPALELPYQDSVAQAVQTALRTLRHRAEQAEAERDASKDMKELYHKQLAESRKEARELKSRYEGMVAAHASVVKQLEALEQK